MLRLEIGSEGEFESAEEASEPEDGEKISDLNRYQHNLIKFCSSHTKKNHPT